MFLNDIVYSYVLAYITKELDHFYSQKFLLKFLNLFHEGRIQILIKNTIHCSFHNIYAARKTCCTLKCVSACIAFVSVRGLWTLFGIPYRELFLITGACSSSKKSIVSLLKASPGSLFCMLSLRYYFRW
jgi:hypothetical protein